MTPSLISILQQVYTFQLSVFMLITNNTVLFHSVCQDGWTALMLASDSGHTDVVQLLLSSGAQVALQDEVRHNINLLIVHKTDG